MVLPHPDPHTSSEVMPVHQRKEDSCSSGQKQMLAVSEGSLAKFQGLVLDQLSICDLLSLTFLTLVGFLYHLLHIVIQSSVQDLVHFSNQNYLAFLPLIDSLMIHSDDQRPELRV